MKKILIWFLSLGIATAEISYEPAGIKMGRKQYTEGENNLRPFHWPLGTEVDFLFILGEGSFIKINHKKSKLTIFTDDQGTDLLKKKKGSFISMSPTPDSGKSEDGKAFMWSVRSNITPAKGARELSIEGIATFTVATKSRQSKSQLVPAKKGTTVTIGEHKIEITKVEESNWGDAKLEVTLKSDLNLVELRRIRFFDKSGKLIPSERSFYGTSSFGSKSTTKVTYNFEKKVDTITVELDEWTDQKEIEVPVKSKIGVGL